MEHGLHRRVRTPEGVIDAIIIDRYWIQDQGWFAKITLEGDPTVGMRRTHQVPLDRIERISGVSYEAIKPRWWLRVKGGFTPQDQPPRG